MLEDRTALAAFYWVGNVSSNWQDKANWLEGVNGQNVAATRYPGSDITVLDDEVFADNSIVTANGQERYTVGNDLRLSSGEAMTLKTIYITSTPKNNCTLAWKNFKFVVEDNTALFLSGATSTDIRLSVDGKYNSMAINSGSVVTVSSGVGYFASPSLTSVAANEQALPDGKLTIVAAKFTFLDLTEKLTVSINVRGANGLDDKTVRGSLSISTFAQGQTPLKKNIDIKNATITVEDAGEMILANKSNSDLRGGFSNGDNSFIVIKKDGLVLRVKDDGDTNQEMKFLSVAPKVINDGGRFEMDEKSSLYLERGLETKSGRNLIDQGRIKTGPGAKIALLGGETSFYASAAGVGTCYVDGEIEVSGGLLTIGGSSAGPNVTSFCKLQTTGDVTFKTGSSFTMSADTSVNGRCDALEAGGTVTITGGWMGVMLVNAPPSGQSIHYTYTMLTAVSVVGQWPIVLFGTWTGNGQGVAWLECPANQQVVHYQINNGSGDGTSPIPT
ncbi:MAG: hypothetical protein ACOVT5_10245 [Armatimonadaceae bacterium]